MNNGITFEGIQLEEYLKKKDETKEPSKEIRDLMSDEVKSHYVKPRLKYLDKREKPSRIRYLTREEILSEYGENMKDEDKGIELPYEVGTHNIFYYIIEQGPITVSELAEKLGVDAKHTTLSAKVAVLWKSVVKRELNLIQRRKNANGVFEYLGTGVPVSKAIAIYESTQGRKYGSDPYSEEIKKYESDLPQQSLNSTEPPDLAMLLSQFVKKIVSEDTINVNIKVNVSVEFKP